ncbi:MAG: hypothetical protein AAGA77_22280 [Bacteroidota bacterium]
MNRRQFIRYITSLVLSIMTGAYMLQEPERYPKAKKGHIPGKDLVITIDGEPIIRPTTATLNRFNNEDTWSEYVTSFNLSDWEVTSIDHLKNGEISIEFSKIQTS